MATHTDLRGAINTSLPALMPLSSRPSSFCSSSRKLMKCLLLMFNFTMTPQSHPYISTTPILLDLMPASLFRRIWINRGMSNRVLGTLSISSFAIWKKPLKSLTRWFLLSWFHFKWADPTLLAIWRSMAAAQRAQMTQWTCLTILVMELTLINSTLLLSESLSKPTRIN